MKQEKLSPLQLFYVMTAFEAGSSVVFGIGAEAKQDAWLTFGVGMLCSFVLVWVYSKLMEQYPGDTLVQMIPKIVGKVLGYPLCLIYIVYFLYLASRALRDFGELIIGTLLTGTPIIVVIGSFAAVILYSLRGGLETFGRIGEIIFPGWLVSITLLWIILFSSQVMDFGQLRPVLEDGGRIWKAAFPVVVTFPFGEMVLFTMFGPAFRDPKKIKTVGMAVVLTTGLLLMINMINILSVIGPQILGKEQFPLLTAAKMGSIGDFIEHIDALLVITMVAGGFFKTGGWLYGAALGTAQLLKLENYQTVLIPIGVIAVPLSLMIAANFTEHVDIGLRVVTWYVHIPIQIVIPACLLGISFIRKTFGHGFAR
jgi:spore germination protein KB